MLGGERSGVDGGGATGVSADAGHDRRVIASEEPRDVQVAVVVLWMMANAPPDFLPCVGDAPRAGPPTEVVDCHASELADLVDEREHIAGAKAVDDIADTHGS